MFAIDYPYESSAVAGRFLDTATIPENTRTLTGHENAADARAPPSPTTSRRSPTQQAAATGLLERALRIGQKKDDAEWLHNYADKAQMNRMDPSFSEKSLGVKSFSDFLRSRSDLVDLDETSTTRMVLLHSDTASSVTIAMHGPDDRERAGARFSVDAPLPADA
jgi:hypothetical protein